MYPKKSLILKLLKENLLNLTKIGVQIVMKKFLCKKISKICVALKFYPKVHTVFNKFFVCEKLYNIKWGIFSASGQGFTVGGICGKKFI